MLRNIVFQLGEKPRLRLAMGKVHITGGCKDLIKKNLPSQVIGGKNLILVSLVRNLNSSWCRVLYCGCGKDRIADFAVN